MVELKEIGRHIKRFLIVRFSLRKDKEEESQITDAIRKGVEFHGANIWVLIFAIFLASIGLNVNSTAVIIGAMLISPLMGPIMGIGLGLSIFDFELLKSAAKNLTIMVVISLLTSTLYFSLSPLSEAQSELLARTTPTIWDVLIALFGGLAGVVAGASKGKGTVIPGVAIATALMPPLCTAGYGLANGDLFIFAGAFYLFCINGVFISLSALIVTRLLKYHPVVLPDKARERRLRNVISLVVVITVIPSILIAYFTVKRELFEQRAQSYLKTEFQMRKTFMLTNRVDYENSSIDIVLTGHTLPADSIAMLRERKNNYALNDIDVRITQGSDYSEHLNLEELKSGVAREMYIDNNRIITEYEQTITGLKQELVRLKEHYPVDLISKELNALGKGVTALAIHDNLLYNADGNVQDTVTIAYAQFTRIPSRDEQRKIHDWLTIRIRADSLLLVPVKAVRD